MGLICTVCSWLCCCCRKNDMSEHSEPDISVYLTKDYYSKTPSVIPDKELTKEFPNRNFMDVLKDRGYDWDSRKEIGKGGFGTVYKINSNEDNKVFAMKVISFKDEDRGRDKRKFKLIKNEIYVISKVKHKNIIKLIDHFIVKDECFLVMEFANSGTVAEEIRKFGPMSELKAQKYFLQISRALWALHKFSKEILIAHRDLKLENILIHIEGKEKIIKLADFGFSNVLKSKNMLRARKPTGNTEYMSPQMIRLVLFHSLHDDNDKRILGKVKSVDAIKADIWSLGVCLYYMIANDWPFDCMKNPDKKELMKITDQQNLGNRKTIDKNISLLLNDLLDKMLEPNTQKRINIKDILKHQWLKNVPQIIFIDEID